MTVAPRGYLRPPTKSRPVSRAAMVQCAPRSRPQGDMGFSRHLAVPLRTDAWASAAFAPFVSTRIGIRPPTQALSLWLAGDGCRSRASIERAAAASGAKSGIPDCGPQHRPDVSMFNRRTRRHPGSARRSIRLVEGDRRSARRHVVSARPKRALRQPESVQVQDGPGRQQGATCGTEAVPAGRLTDPLPTEEA